MPTPYSIKADFNVPIQMRDGATTYADIFRPDAPGEQFTVLLTRTPYDKSSPQNRTGTLDVVRAAMSGYAAVVQDVRGRFTSEGEFYTFTNEINDGYDSIEWLASQPWCTGKVGTFGISYVGATQWLAAKSKPPSLTAIAPGFTAHDYHEGWAWQGGAFELGFNLSWSVGSLAGANWANLSQKINKDISELNALIASKDSLGGGFSHLPMQEMPDLKEGIAPYYYDWLSTPTTMTTGSKSASPSPTPKSPSPRSMLAAGTTYSSVGRYRTTSACEPTAPPTSPAVASVCSSAPGFTLAPRPPSQASTTSAPARQRQQLTCPASSFATMTTTSRARTTASQTISPSASSSWGINEWRYENEWPLERAEDVRYYLHSGGRANTLNGDGSLNPESPADESPDVFVYKPDRPRAHKRRWPMLRPRVHGARRLRSAPRRGPSRCAGLFHAANGTGHRGYRSHNRNPLRIHIRHRHRLHR